MQIYAMYLLLTFLSLLLLYDPALVVQLLLPEVGGGDGLHPVTTAGHSLQEAKSGHRQEGR